MRYGVKIELEIDKVELLDGEELVFGNLEGVVSGFFVYFDLFNVFIIDLSKRKKCFYGGWFEVERVYINIFLVSIIGFYRFEMFIIWFSDINF